MSRNHDFNSEKVCIVGRSGQGKSTFQRQLLLNWPADYFFIFDHKGEFARKCGFWTARTDAECDAALTQNRLVCFQPQGNKKSALEIWLDKVFKGCQQLPGRKLIVFDEGGLLLPRQPSKPKDTKDASGNVTPEEFWHPFQAIQETGREWGIDVLCASQRPIHFCQDFRGQFTRFVCFKMTSSWTKPLTEDFGEDFSPCSSLDKGQFIAYNTDTGEFENGESTP